MENICKTVKNGTPNCGFWTPVSSKVDERPMSELMAEKGTPKS